MSMGAMLDMMQRMMGKDPGKGQGEGQGDQPGQGREADSDSPNKGLGKGGEGLTEKRTVPKAAGSAGANLPREFQKALDAYNKNR